MVSMIDVKCDRCNSLVTKCLSEVNRSNRLGRKLFCSRSCAAKQGNVPRRSKEFIAVCPHCAVRFLTSTHNKAKRFCSRSCASKGSMTVERREAQRRAGREHQSQLISTAECLRKREAWKYVALKEVLNEREYEFEFELGGYVFDLVLLDVKIVIEFDGKYHRGTKQREIDLKKEQVAKDAGFKVIRRSVEETTVISPATIVGL